MFHLCGAGFLNFECQSLEKRYTILSFDFLKDNRKLFRRDLGNKVTLEHYNHMITGKNRAESVALIAEEAESVALENFRLVEMRFSRGLS
jgi:hypothetical protein